MLTQDPDQVIAPSAMTDEQLVTTIENRMRQDVAAGGTGRAGRDLCHVAPSRAECADRCCVVQPEGTAARRQLKPAFNKLEPERSC
jgi:hypothetical protein